MRVLVADENPVTQKVLVNMLTFQGHNARDLVGGHDDLVESLTGNACDLVLVDWSLAAADDFQLLKTMKDRNLFQLKPMLIMVPGMEQKLIDQAAGYGAQDFLPKPIPAHMLEQKLSELVGAVDGDQDGAQENGGPATFFINEDEALDGPDEEVAAPDPTPVLDLDEDPGPELFAEDTVEDSPASAPSAPSAPSAMDLLDDTGGQDKAASPLDGLDVEPAVEPVAEPEPVPAKAQPVNMGDTADMLEVESPEDRAKRHFLLGKELLAKGKTNHAINEFAKAINLKEVFPEALRGVAVAFLRAKDVKRSKHFLDKAAEAYVLSTRFDEAEQFFKELKEKGHNPVNPFRKVADSLRGQSDFITARKLYERAMAADPTDAMSVRHLITCCRELGDTDQAVSVLTALLKRHGGPDWAKSQYTELTGTPWGGAPGGEAAVMDSAVPNTDLATMSSDSMKILVVDDEPHIRLLLEQSLEALEDEGVTLLFADNGKDGLDTIQKETPDLVFLDVMMPKMNGFEVCSAVKQKLKMDEVYIVMLTAKGQEFDRKKGLKAGADVYMTKPFRPLEVVRLARAVLDLV
ncbi:MAG: response regulator [Desulfovibrio sp.]|nr:MAG: response regulator [Desulfovibrio sp.]